MGVADKFQNWVKLLRGKGKEAAGSADRDEGRRLDGRAEQTRADLRQAGEKVKDAFRRR